MALDNTLGDLPSMFCGLSYDGYTDHSTPSDYFWFTDPQPVIFPQMAAEPSSNLSSSASRATNTKTEDWEFISDKSLNYICQMLMEKNIDEKVSIYQEIATLRSTAKPFYDTPIVYMCLRWSFLAHKLRYKKWILKLLMLMEKNIDEKVSIYQEIATLRSAAKPFYDTPIVYMCLRWSFLAHKLRYKKWILKLLVDITFGYKQRRELAHQLREKKRKNL